MKQNEICEVTIIDEDINGNGIAKVSGLVIFIPKTLKQEVVQIEIIEIKKKYAIGKLLKIIESSPARIKSTCPYYDSCGGCSFLHTTYEKENSIKEKVIKNNFNYKVNNLISINEYNYRNKVSFHVNEGKIGFYQTNSHDFIEIDNCLLLNKNINELLIELKKLDLKGINKIVIKGEDELLISFYGDILLKELELLTNGKVKSIYLNDSLVKGSSFINIDINKYKFIMTPNSFFQVNSSCMIKLYDKIKEYALTGDLLLDLYCGTGTIGIYLNDNFKEIKGIELVKESVINANINKRNNKINNINFINKDASYIPLEKYDCIIVDPPRAGLNKKTLKKIKELNSKRIIYVSCNYLTLKRDLKELEKQYKILEITPFNMFPKTSHIETVCLLSRNMK